MMHTEPEIASVFRGVQRLLWGICTKFKRQHGGSLNNLYSESCYTFMVVYNEYHSGEDKERAPFHLWLRAKVWYALLERARIIAKRWSIAHKVRCPVDRIENCNYRKYGKPLLRASGCFDTNYIIGDLPDDDCRLAATLAVKQVCEVGTTLRSSSHRVKIRRMLQQHGLKIDRIGWCFNEVKMALGGNNVPQTTKERWGKK